MVTMCSVNTRPKPRSFISLVRSGAGNGVDVGLSSKPGSDDIGSFVWDTTEATLRQQMTRAIRFTSIGGPEVLELFEVTLPEPKAGEALVRHRAIGVNFIDTSHRSGLYPLPLPSGLGSEAAGVVEQVGPGVTCIRVGERVAYAAGAPAAYAEARVLSAERLVPLPDDISD